MDVWLVYQKDNIAGNQFFINRWEDAAKERGVFIRVVSHEDLVYGVHGQQAFIRHRDRYKLPDVAVMRLNAPLLSAQFELLHIPVFNNAHVARLCNDKRLTHQMILPYAPMMDTVFLRGDEETSPLPYPVVIKAAHGCGGRQVFLVSNEKEFISALSRMKPDSALVQVVCDTPGRDIRAYVLGKRIVRVMQRLSSEDFRSNINQGGHAIPYDMKERDLQMVRSIISLFDFGLVGIDFILHQGRLVFNEIEDAVGTRMLYNLGEFDIVKLYLDEILQRTMP